MKKFIFIVILSLISTDIAFSEEKKKSTDQITNYFKKKKEEHTKKNAPIDFEEVIKLGEPIIIEDLPEGMVKKFGKSCTEFLCRTKKLQKLWHVLLRDQRITIIENQEI